MMPMTIVLNMHVESFVRYFDSLLLNQPFFSFGLLSENKGDIIKAVLKTGVNCKAFENLKYRKKGKMTELC